MKLRKEVLICLVEQMSQDHPQKPVDLNNLSKDGVLAAVEEAKDAPTQFKPKERAAYVRERVQEIRRLRALGQTDTQIKAALGTFVTQYPTLFAAAVEPNFNEKQLEFMLGLFDKMERGMTQHQASVIVGEKLADKYINPVVGKKSKYD